MIDKLYLKTKDPAIEFCPSITSQKIHAPDNFYEAIYRYEENGRYALIKTKPKNPHISPVKIETNPVKWPNSSELIKWVASQTDPEKLFISRIDCAVDTTIPVIDLWKSVRIKHKQDGSFHFPSDTRTKRGEVTGFYIGSKPEVWCIYDKAYEKRVKKLFKIKGAESGIKSRIEVRLESRKVPVKPLTDINQYLNINPFEKLVCMELINRDDQKTKELEESIRTFGFANNYLMLNMHSNFFRDAKKSFSEVPLNEQLHKTYQDNLRQYFKEEL